MSISLLEVNATIYISCFSLIYEINLTYYSPLLYVTQ